MSRELGLPVPPGFVITTETCRRFLAGWLAGRPRRRAARADGRRRGRPRAALRRPGRPAARQRPLGRARVDARDDGHDPRPRPRTTRRPPVSRASPATRRSPDRAATVSRRASARSSASPRSRPTRGPSCAWPSRPSSARGRAIAPGRIGGRRASPTTSGTAVTVQAMVFGNRGPDSATGVLFTRDPATGEPALYGDVLFDAQGEDVVAGTHRTEPIAVLDERLPEVAAELRGGRRAARAPLPRPVRHRVHDRVGPALAAPGPGRQAKPAGGAADRGRHGRGRVVPADPGRGGRARAAAPRRPADDHQRSEQLRPAAASPACPPRRGWPAAGSPRPPRLPRRPRPAARRPSSSGPRPRRTTSTAWPRRPASSPRGAVSRATPRSSPAAGASRPSSGRPASTWRTTGS